MKRLHRDHWAGGLLVVIGIGMGVAASNRPLGTLTAMGAGFFPLMLSILLALLGAAIALGAPRTGDAPTLPSLVPAAPTPLYEAPIIPEWRGWGCIVTGVAAFIGLGTLFGLVPATFACVLISAFGDRGTRWPGALLLAAGVTLVGVLVFSILLRVPFPVLQWGPQ